MLHITRRKLLKSGVVGAGVLGVTGTAAWFGRDRIRLLQSGELTHYLKANFEYLTFNFDDEQITEHVANYLESYQEVPRETWHVLRGGDADQHAQTMDHFAMTFLMSTDFFLHGADESRPVNYVMFFHPYRSPCWNPVSMYAGTN